MAEIICRVKRRVQVEAEDAADDCAVSDSGIAEAGVTEACDVETHECSKPPMQN